MNPHEHVTINSSSLRFSSFSPNVLFWPRSHMTPRCPVSLAPLVVTISQTSFLFWWPWQLGGGLGWLCRSNWSLPAVFLLMRLELWAWSLPAVFLLIRLELWSWGGWPQGQIVIFILSHQGTCCHRGCRLWHWPWSLGWRCVCQAGSIKKINIYIVLKENLGWDRQSVCYLVI